MSEDPGLFYTLKEAGWLTSLRQDVLRTICKNTVKSGLAYKTKSNKWMIHSSVLDKTSMVLKGDKVLEAHSRK
jgi:hypothetical protein